MFGNPIEVMMFKIKNLAGTFSVEYKTNVISHSKFGQQVAS
jgi:hypothetical protein